MRRMRICVHLEENGVLCSETEGGLSGNLNFPLFRGGLERRDGVGGASKKGEQKNAGTLLIFLRIRSIMDTSEPEMAELEIRNGT